MNKMTDDELMQFDDEIYHMSLNEGIRGYPDLNVAYMSKTIDRGILYQLFKLGDPKIT